MSSSNIEETDFGETLSEASVAPPQRRKNQRPSKRRRISDTSETDSISDFIDDDDLDGAERRKRQRRALVDDYLSDESEKHQGQRKGGPKHKVRITHDPALPATTVPPGAPLSSNPDSSPYRIRGARWKLPMAVAPNGRALESLKPKREGLRVNQGGPSGLRETPNSPPPVISEQKKIPPSVSFKGTDVCNLPKLGPGPSPTDIAQELADLPSDAFSSPERSPPPVSRLSENQKSVPSQTGLCQTTLFGGRAPLGRTSSQTNRVHNYCSDKAPEAPTHHKLDQGALNTWTYPTNLGSIREYQFNIVRNGLFHNVLVALPTGLGKTFIAATIMFNYYRWTKDAKIVFMAPTKPLVSQQIDACFNIVGIPRSITTMLTGETPPAVRTEEWEVKRVFFMTPQTLDNDLRTGIADPKKIVLLVIDEAHRATGNYSYVGVVSFMRRFSSSFRILALTATPGSTVEAVQEVIDNLEISKVEIRTEESMDIQQFTHRLKIEQIILDPSDEMIMIKDHLSKALQPLVNQLCSQNAFYSKDPMSLTPYGLLKAKQAWLTSDVGRRANPGLKGMMSALFAILSSVAHSIKLLNFHGIGPFYSSIQELRKDVEERGAKASKYKKDINSNVQFIRMMDKIREWMNGDNFVGHPKLTYLCDAILNHFLDAGEGRLPAGAPPSGTRVIVFSEFRDSAEEIARILNRHNPMVRASVFVGQTDSKRSEGMNQAKQQETIRKFKAGIFNVLVATSIGEEGLDIGQVDLIVCYDASGSPIRMLQRMGRTGRKRAGRVVLLLMRGKEEEAFKKAKDGYEQMQKMICSGTHFRYRHDLSTRIVPKDINPVVDKRHIDIPPENTQDKSLPEPKRRASHAKRRPPKKFNMPDGVHTGFRKASKLVDDGESSEEILPLETVEAELMPVPALEDVLLTHDEERELERRFQSVSGHDAQEVSAPDLNNHPESQRFLGPAKLVQHGQGTTRFVDMIQAMGKVTKFTVNKWRQVYDIERPFAEECAASWSPARSSSEQSAPEASDHRLRSRTTRNSTKSGQSLWKSGAPSDSESSPDDDAHLQDFVVRNHMPRGGASKRTGSPPGMRSQQEPFFEPTPFAATQDTNEDDLPDLGDLLGREATRRQPSPPKETRLDNSGGRRAPGRRGRRRAVVEDSDE